MTKPEDVSFAEMADGVRVAHASDDDMYMIFGDPESPRHVELIDRVQALKAGVGLAAMAAGAPMYGHGLIMAALNGAAVAVPPLRVEVVVFDKGDVYKADVYGVTDRTVTVSIGTDEQERDMLQDIQPSQILRMTVTR